MVTEVALEVGLRCCRVERLCERVYVGLSDLVPPHPADSFVPFGYESRSGLELEDGACAVSAGGGFVLPERADAAAVDPEGGCVAREPLIPRERIVVEEQGWPDNGVRVRTGAAAKRLPLLRPRRIL